MRNRSYQRSTFLFSRHFCNRGIKDLWMNLECGSCHQKESVVISRCCFAEAGTDFFISIAQTARLFLLRPIKFLIYGVVIAVPVVDAKAPSFFFWVLFFCFHFFAEDERDLFISTFRTCITIIFPHLANQIIVCALPLPFFLSLLQLPN